MNLVFDIGCNVGEFYTKCLQEYPDCKVVAVDANHNLLTEGIRGNITLVNALVGAGEVDHVDFYIEPRQSGISTASRSFIENSRFTKGSENLRPNSAFWAHPVKVKVVTLDSLIKEYGTPDYIKIDVEGYEYEVLRGLTSKQKTLAFEWHEEDLETLFSGCDHLENLGYTEFGITAYLPSETSVEGMTFDSRGDSYLLEPKEFFPWAQLKKYVLSETIPERRVAYGMLTAK